MKLLLDTANLDEIKNYLSYLPVHGVTTNPSILSAEENINPVKRLIDIREMIGKNRSLHVQVVSTDFEGILKDAYQILDSIDNEVFIKIPVTNEGLKAIKILKKEKINITATAVYSKIQALIALDLGVDYIAPYVNRMVNLELDPYDLIECLSHKIKERNSSTKLIGASFKNIGQVTNSVESGSHYVTVNPNTINKFTENYNTEKAITDFTVDWYYKFKDKRF